MNNPQKLATRHRIKTNKTKTQYNMCDGHHYTKTNTRDNRGRDCKVVGFTTTCAISAYHHNGYEFEPR